MSITVSFTRETTAHNGDRRVRRSRRLIREAFVELVVASSYSGLTVEAIVERADVARGTFYAHFDSIESLCADVVRDLVADLLVRAEEVAPSESGSAIEGAALRLACRHIAEHLDVYRVILSGAGNGTGRAAYAEAAASVMERVINRLCAVNGVTPRLSTAVVARAWAGSFLGLVDWWLAEAPERSADDVASLAAIFLARGFLWSAGLEDHVELAPRVMSGLLTGVPERSPGS